MGGEMFENKASAKTADEAFAKAREKALYDYGHSGYTGTIAEKQEFKMVTPNSGESPTDCVRRCQEDEKHFSGDKWGPAACVDLGENLKVPGEHLFYFFGWASS